MEAKRTAVEIRDVRIERVKPSGEFGGPGRDRTDDLFHAMEARSQLRHRPTCEGEFPWVRNSLGIREGTTIIFAYRNPIVNASNILLISFHRGFCHN